MITFWAWHGRNHSFYIYVYVLWKYTFSTACKLMIKHQGIAKKNIRAYRTKTWEWKNPTNETHQLIYCIQQILSLMRSSTLPWVRHLICINYHSYIYIKKTAMFLNASKLIQWQMQLKHIKLYSVHIYIHITHYHFASFLFLTPNIFSRLIFCAIVVEEAFRSIWFNLNEHNQHE